MRIGVFLLASMIPTATGIARCEHALAPRGVLHIADFGDLKGLGRLSDDPARPGAAIPRRAPLGTAETLARDPVTRNGRAPAGALRLPVSCG